jgi:hypothetical protein
MEEVIFQKSSAAAYVPEYFGEIGAYFPEDFWKKVAYFPMGVLAPRFAHAGPSAQPPIHMSGNFLAPVSAEWLSNISPSPSKVESEVSASHSGIYIWN